MNVLFSLDRACAQGLSRLMARCVLGAGLVFASSALSQPAHAAEEESPPAGAGKPAEPVSTATEAERAQAQALFDSARALMLEGKYEPACPQLEQSQRLDPGLGTQFNLAACYEATGRLASAHALFVEVAATAGERGQVEREQVARRRAEDVKPKLSKLSIVVSPDQVGRIRVERDGANLSPGEIGVAVPVDAGKHQIVAYGDGLVEWSTEIVVPEEARVHTLVVPPLSEKSLERPASAALPGVPDRAGDGASFWTPTHHKLGVVAGGVGVLGIGIGSVFALRAISLSDESDDLGCFGNLCPTAEALEKREQAQTAGHVATASIVTGLAGFATAAVLFLFVGDDDDHAAMPFLPRVAGEEGELIWQGRF